MPQLSTCQFERFRGFIYERSGVRIGDHKVALLSNRIRQRLKACGLADFDAYYRLLKSQHRPDELDQFLDAVTTNETSFFRSPEHFEWFGKEFIKEASSLAFRGLRPKTLKVWSAACSSGEEAFSLAITLASHGLSLRGWRVELTATDISQEMLHRARAGRFKQRAIESLTADQLRRHFSRLPDEDVWEIKEKHRQAVDFRQHNLLLPASGGPYDCVFLRNVLIYFDRDSKRRVIDNMADALAPNGYLVLGPSEGAWDFLGAFEKRRTWLYQKPPGGVVQP